MAPVGAPLKRPPGPPHALLGHPLGGTARSQPCERLPSVAREPTADGAARNGCRLLVVEDDRELCESIADVLRLTGYEVETALDGEAALEALRRAPPPHAVLLDLVLPRATAGQVLAALRAAAAPPAVVLMTGLAPAYRGPFAEGEVLMKPFGAQQLVERVARACGRDDAWDDGGG